MRKTNQKSILALLLITTLVATQFLPGYSAVLHAEEAGAAGTSTEPTAEETSGTVKTSEVMGTSELNNVTDSPPEGIPEVTETVPEEVTDEVTPDETEDSAESSTTTSDQNTATTSTATDNEQSTTIGSAATTTETITSPPASSTPAVSTTTVATSSAPVSQEPLSLPIGGSVSTSGSEASSTNATTTTTATTTAEATTTLQSHSTSTPAQILSLTSTSTPATSTQQAATTTATTTGTPMASTTTTSTTDFGTSTPAIVSGEAVAMANILNILNTNMVNSTGAVILSNYFDDQRGTVDLRSGTTTLVCQLLSCSSHGIQVNLLNNANIDNSLLITATSGENIIDGAGSAIISTGNAYAGLNLVNVANTNFIDSRYLLVSLNAFKDVNGDIVFPGLATFFTALNPTAATQHINNTAVVENEVSVASNAGNNSTESASSTIATGNAQSTSNVFNSLNTSLLGGNSLNILLRVHGTWAGNIFGAPEEFHMLRDSSSLYISNGTSTVSDDIVVNATNTSMIRNRVTVSADTGNNAITNASSSLIETGDAIAGANVVTIANANVVGRNWMLAIINIFGDFNGNVAFGRPDLWVGEQVSVPSRLDNGSEVVYKFTVINNGDSDATKVLLKETYDTQHIEILESSHDFTESEAGTLSWNIGKLPSGSATEITYRARIKNTTPGTDITNIVNVIGYEPDNNMLDNTDTATLSTSESRRGSRAREDRSVTQESQVAAATSPIEAVSVVRNTNTTIVKNINTVVTQELVVRNETAYTVQSLVLNDTLSDPQGTVLQNEKWDIGDLLPHEEVILTYEVRFGKKAAPGAYPLSTTLQGKGGMSRSFPLNGVIHLLAPEPLVPALTVKKAEASYETAPTPELVAEEIVEEPVPTETPPPTAAAADSGFPFHPLWLIFLGIGSIAVAERKRMYQWLFL